MVSSLFSKTPQTNERPVLAILIVNYNSWPDVSRLVAELARAPEVAERRCEIVVVDNASSGRVPENLASPPPGVRLVNRSDNGGFAVGVNAGWRETQAEWLLLLNPDVIASADLPGRVLERIQSWEPRPADAPGVLGFALRNGDGSPQPSVGAEPSLSRCVREAFIPRSRRKYQADQHTKPGRAPWVTGAFALVHSALLRELGGMDEDFFLYYEEVALCESARKLGRRVEYDPTIEVIHLRPLQSRVLSPELRVITRHSKLLYFLKHRPYWEFQILSHVVSAESVIRGTWAWLSRQGKSSRAWRSVGEVARDLRKGRSVRGAEVLALAEGSRPPTHGIVRSKQLLMNIKKSRHAKQEA
jgi:N-acetylglucosaminyl-diphospho-decaprenol L-rhamnosyltransferase